MPLVTQGLGTAIANDSDDPSIKDSYTCESRKACDRHIHRPQSADTTHTPMQAGRHRCRDIQRNLMFWLCGRWGQGTQAVIPQQLCRLIQPWGNEREGFIDCARNLSPLQEGRLGAPLLPSYPPVFHTLCFQRLSLQLVAL